MAKNKVPFIPWYENVASIAGIFYYKCPSEVIMYAFEIKYQVRQMNEILYFILKQHIISYAVVSNRDNKKDIDEHI